MVTTANALQGAIRIAPYLIIECFWNKGMCRIQKPHGAQLSPTCRLTTARRVALDALPGTPYTR